MSSPVKRRRDLYILDATPDSILLPRVRESFADPRCGGHTKEVCYGSEMPTMIDSSSLTFPALDPIVSHFATIDTDELVVGEGIMAG